MAKKQSGVFDDIVAIAAMLPWWAGVGLALAAYFVLHHFAVLPAMPAPRTVADMTGTVQHTLVTTFCGILQYVVPGALLLGALVSALKARKAKQLYFDARAMPEEDRLSGFTWKEFETLVGEAFRQRGFSVHERGGSGPDGGVDLELRLGSDKYFVQCKHWKAKSVSVAPVRELFGVMSAEGAVGGFVVASGAFTSEAKRFVEGRSIELVDAVSLARGAAPRRSTAEAQHTCPRCGAAMVRRRARRGVNAGADFWGCQNYPSCKGTAPL